MVYHLHPHSVLCVLVCVVWGDPPTAPSGGDTRDQFTDVLAHFIILYCRHQEGAPPDIDSHHYFAEGHISSLLYHSHHLEEGQGSVDWKRRITLNVVGFKPHKMFTVSEGT